jgi:hypothetical protein
MLLNPFSSSRQFETAIPPHAGHFSTLQRLAPLQRQNSRLSALRQLPLRSLRFNGKVPEKSPMRALGIRFPNYPNILSLD